MDRFLIILPHTMEDCVRALKLIEGIGMITHFDWGCKDGDHTGYVIIEAENKNEALLVMPSGLREKARIIKVAKFSPEEVRAMHL
jgi:hypothetical protein